MRACLVLGVVHQVVSEGDAGAKELLPIVRREGHVRQMLQRLNHL
jgi:hypothetical protein